MPVSNDEAGEECATVEVDHPRQAAAKGQHRLLVAHALDAARADGD